MMVMTAKVNLKKVMIALAAVAALIVALICCWAGVGIPPRLPRPRLPATTAG